VIVADPTKGKRAPAATLSDHTAHPHAPPKRGPLLVVGILAGIAALVLVAGGIGTWAIWFREPTTPLATQLAKAPALEANAEEQGAQAPEKSAAKKADDDESAASATGPTKAELSAQAKTVQAISSWQNMAGVKSFGVSNANLQVTRVWRTEAGQGEDKKQGGPYVCVEVTIRNKSRAPLRYKGWNSFGENGAILANESNEVLPLVPVESTPELTRLKRTSVPGSGVVTEILVFAAPASEEEVLHLVLPYSAFYSNVRPPHRAIELTPDVMGIDLAATTETTSSPSVEPAEAEATPAAPAGAGAAAADKPAEKPVAKRAAGGKPESLRDMINSEPGPPAKPDDEPATKGDQPKDEKPKDEKPKGDKNGKDAPQKPENPFEPKGDNPLDPLSVVPKGEDEKEP
jgi:hypothetical protein